MPTSTIVAIGLNQILTGWENNIHSILKKVNLWLCILGGQFVERFITDDNFNANEYRGCLNVRLFRREFNQLWMIFVKFGSSKKEYHHTMAEMDFYTMAEMDLSTPEVF